MKSLFYPKPASNQVKPIAELEITDLMFGSIFTGPSLGQRAPIQFFPLIVTNSTIRTGFHDK